MDKIMIKRLEIFANHGAIPAENELGQKFLITAELQCDLRRAGKTDELDASVNYSKVCELIKNSTQGNTYKLIERLAEHLASKILYQFSQVKSVELTVEKPWAPVLLPLETVSVTINRTWHRVYLSLGSNMGEKKDHLDKAIALIKDDKNFRIIDTSDYIETKPVGYTQQDDFLNAALVADTLYTPEELLDVIHDMEASQKRERTIHWGPRTIDIDIIFYDDEIIYSDDLVIPHPLMCERLFVLEPLNQIAPYMIHPINKKSVEMIYKECNK